MCNRLLDVVLALISCVHPDQLWQLFITQAFLFGIGSSMLYYPMTSLTPQFFDKHRGFAMGIALSGSGAGGLVFAPVTQALFDRWGASATLRILGVWNFVVLIPISFIIRRPPGYSPVRPSLALAKRGAFILQVRTATRVDLRPIIQVRSFSLRSFKRRGTSSPCTIYPYILLRCWASLPKWLACFWP